MAIVDGWGRGTWGEGSWGSNIPVVLVGDESLRAVTTLSSVTIKTDVSISLSGQQLTTTLNSVTAKSDVNISLSGQQLTISLNSVSVDIKTFANITGQLITTVVGELDVGPDATVSGEQVPLYIGDVNISGTGNLSLTGQPLSLSLNSVTIALNTPVNITGQNLTTSLNSVIPSIAINVPVTGLPILDTFLLADLNTTLHDSMTTNDTSAFVNGLTIYEQIPDSGQAKIQNEWVSYASKYIYTFDADTFVLDGLVRGIKGTTAATHPVNAPIAIHDAVSVTGNADVSISSQQLTLALGSVDSSYDAEVTGQQLTTTLGSVGIEIITDVSVTGQQLTLNLNSVSIALGVVVDLTGNLLTGQVGQVYVSAWAQVNTGSTISYTGVNTGQSINWTEVAA